MAGSKGSLKPKVVVPADELQTALNPASPSGLSGDNTMVTGGPLGAAAEERAVATAAAPLVAQAKDDALTTTDKVVAAAQETYTGYIVEAMDRSYSEQFNDFDPSFDGKRHALDLLNQLGVEPTEKHLEVLARAGTEENQIEQAQRMAQHKTNQEILSKHGVYAVASGVLDPAMLITDIATFGASKALSLGRLGAGALGATGATAYTYAADVSGKETQAFEYLLNASLVGGANALFAGGVRPVVLPGGLPGTGAAGTATGVRRSVNAFVSETDKLAATPEAADVLRTLVDDPVRRSGLLTNNNAASFQRMYSNEADGLIKAYDDSVEQELSKSFNWAQRKLDVSGRYADAKDALNSRVTDELLRRDDMWSRFGHVMPDPNGDPVIARLADQSDAFHGRLGEMARDAGVRGFEDFTARPGYFHRSWNDTLFQAAERSEKGIVRKLLAESVERGIKGVDKDEADAIAGALVQRVHDKASGMRSDFMGALGKADTTFLRESLEAAKVSAGRIESIMGKIEQKASDQGTSKYGKHRLTLDMSASVRAKDGTVYRVADLIDRDLDRIMENYGTSLSGRSALSKAGIASDDAGLEAFKRSYLASINKLPQAEQADLMQQLEGLLGDFTGHRPDANILGANAQRVKSVADATMLSASGLWQVAEYATMAQRHGVVETGKEFMRRFPGIRNVLQSAKTNPDLADELHTVLGLDLARDVRLRPWKRQHDAFLESSDTMIDRILHAGKQAVPYLNGMKFIHSHQSRMNANLVLNKFARAAQGDAKALAEIRKYAPDLDWAKAEQAIKSNVTYVGKNAREFNWSRWAPEDVDGVMNAALRMMDDALLYGRAGQGASFSRSQVGQVLGQFRSFVSFANNKLLRGTLNADGPKGLASLMAFQYPMTFLMVSVNDARKGQLDLSEKGVTKMAKSAIGYTAALGFVGDAAGILGLTGGRGGLSTPLTGVFDALPRAAGGIAKVSGITRDPSGDYQGREGAADIGKAATMVVPFLNVMPGTAMALEALKDK